MVGLQLDGTQLDVLKKRLRAKGLAKAAGAATPAAPAQAPAAPAITAADLARLREEVLKAAGVIPGVPPSGQVRAESTKYAALAKPFPLAENVSNVPRSMLQCVICLTIFFF